MLNMSLVIYINMLYVPHSQMKTQFTHMYGSDNTLADSLPPLQAFCIGPRTNNHSKCHVFDKVKCTAE